MFAEGAFFNGYALFGYKSDYFFVKLLCQRRLGCGVEAGPTPFAAVTMKGKIADKQYLTADVEHASIHFAGFVSKDTQIHQLLSGKLSILEGVLFTDA
jgi:hypothetical protein